MIPVDYSEAVEAFYTARDDGIPLPEAVTSGSPARQLRDAVEPLAQHTVWSPAVNDHFAGIGLDFLAGYAGGRGSVLGDPAGAVVAAAFAWFEPGLVAALWNAAREVIPPAQLAKARDEAVAASLRDVLAGEDVAGVADLLADAAEPAEGTGRPLFSGLRAAGRPSDPVLRLWWACALIREHRGDSHIAAAAVAGLGPVEMNILTELWIGMPLLSYTATRGWPAEVMEKGVRRLESQGWIRYDGLTDAGRSGRQDVEYRTDQQEQSIVAAIGGQLDDVCDQLNAWGQLCIEAGAFPPDILKRAAG
jgi:hypothetical protein